MEIDTFEKLDIGFDSVKCIVHISDIHVRLTKRHDEYREAFQKVYEGIAKTPPETIIVNTGDTFHSKVDLSPEAVQVVSEFLKGLADLRPLILIAGNHDCLLTNSTRLDSLSPIVDNLKHEKLFYLKESKLYSAGNILFNNMSVFDDPTKYIKMESVVKSIKSKFDHKIALFHGPVNDAFTDIGYKINNRTILPELFDGHDIALLGDIHLMQDMQPYDAANNKPIIHYAGSCIMQNHGEGPTGHGYSVWNLAARKYVHIEVPNDYGYFTVDVVDGVLTTDITNIPCKAKLRVRCKESVPTEVKKAVTEIRKVSNLTDLVYVRAEGDLTAKKLNTQNAANLSKISNVDYQNELIVAFLKDKFPVIDQSTLDSVVEINKNLNELIGKDDQSKNIRWRPKKFEFSNMFSYGENNVIDFTKLSDVYGLFAPNASGKSTLMDAFCFCLFDKSARAYKASLVMNSEKMSFNCKFNFEINGVDYFITRHGIRDKKGSVSVKVKFYKEVDGVEVPLNAEARRSTNELIRDYLGDYDDFILTSLSLQKDRTSFIDMGQSERKDLLAQFIGLNIFDKLETVVSDKVKEISGALKSFNKEDNTKKSADMQVERDNLSAKLEELKLLVNSAKDEVSTITGLITEETKKIVILEDVPLSVDKFITDKSLLEKQIVTNTELEKIIKIELVSDKEGYQLDQQKLKEFDVHNLDEKYTLWEVAQRNVATDERLLEKLTSSVKEKMKKLDHLSKHEYDPNCKYCMDNIFVKDAIATRGELEGDKLTGKSLVESLEAKKKLVEEYAPFLKMIKEKNALAEEVRKKEVAISNKEVKLLKISSELDRAKSSIESITKKIELFEKSKEVIAANKIVQATISDLNQQLKNKNFVLTKLQDEYLKDYSRKTSLTDQINTINARITEIESFENKHAAYQYYAQAIGQNGIPYQLISEAIPLIESEVNNILSQIVEFSVSIETDGKNVNAIINYEDRKWPLELCSGMEQFIASLAIRVGLTNISNLPRANFMVIDEGFSALDASNFPMVHSLFDFMKKNYDFIIVISHLDAMRDMVDKQLEITKENGFSRIDNTK